jgi:hypothetical protein
VSPSAALEAACPRCADDAVVIAGIERPGAVVFEDDRRARAQAGVVVNKVAKLVIGGASTLSTANGAALEVHDSGVGSRSSRYPRRVAPGTLDEGIILDGVHGKVSITGVRESAEPAARFFTPA